MLQYRLSTGADFCDAFVTSTDSSYLLAFLFDGKSRGGRALFRGCSRSGFQSQCRFQGVGHFVD
jgi:hypothetical protein